MANLLAQYMALQEQSASGFKQLNANNQALMGMFQDEMQYRENMNWRQTQQAKADAKYEEYTRNRNQQQDLRRQEWVHKEDIRAQNQALSVADGLLARSFALLEPAKTREEAEGLVDQILAQPGFMDTWKASNYYSQAQTPEDIRELLLTGKQFAKDIADQEWAAEVATAGSQMSRDPVDMELVESNAARIKARTITEGWRVLENVHEFAQQHPDVMVAAREGAAIIGDLSGTKEGAEKAAKEREEILMYTTELERQRFADAQMIDFPAMQASVMGAVNTMNGKHGNTKLSAFDLVQESLKRNGRTNGDGSHNWATFEVAYLNQPVEMQRYPAGHPKEGEVVLDAQLNPVPVNSDSRDQGLRLLHEAFALLAQHPARVSGVLKGQTVLGNPTAKLSDEKRREKFKEDWELAWSRLRFGDPEDQKKGIPGGIAAYNGDKGTEYPNFIASMTDGAYEWTVRRRTTAPPAIQFYNVPGMGGR